MTFSEPLISIIIPVYNVERYLDRCVKSVLEQTHRNSEIILVDDGSPDCCPEKCNAWAARDNRIQVIHKKNGGLSDARNAGMSSASGEFIAFVDSDDWIAPTFLERMLTAINESGSDICECGVLKTNIEREFPAKKSLCESFSAEDALSFLIQDKKFHQHVWNKLYKRECIGKIAFKSGQTHEDEFWTYQVFGRAAKISKISDILYAYFQRDNSIMSSEFSLHRLDSLDAKVERQKYIEEYYPALGESARLNLFASCIYCGQMAMKYLNKTDYHQAKTIIDSIRKISVPSKQAVMQMSRKEGFWIGLAIISFWNACRLKNMFGKGF